MRHLLTDLDLSAIDYPRLLADACRLKAARRKGVPANTLAGKVIALVFEKPSLRTRVSFEAGVAQLGGRSLFLPGSEVGLGWRETHADFARTISRMVDALVLRVVSQETIDRIAASSAVPVVNALSDRWHPCQALADLLTVQEAFGTCQGKTVAFVGDGNNVARSLAVGCGRVGARFVLACPKGYQFDTQSVAELVAAGVPEPETVHDPKAAVASADIIYTDVWTSMGQEAEREERLRRFARFQVNESLLSAAPSHCRVLHCLPAHRGEEISDVVLDGPRSLVFDQAENRLHAQKAVLDWLLS